MNFARRTEDCLQFLLPGGSVVRRLQPMTPGKIVIKAFEIPGKKDTADDAPLPRAVGGEPLRSGREGAAEPGRREHHDGREARSRREPQPSRGRGVAASDRRTIDHRASARDGELADGTIGDGDRNLGGLRPATDVTLTLLRAGTPVKHDPNHIAYDHELTGDHWALQIERRGGDADEQCYRIEVSYPTVLPIETRRIPVNFFVRSFRENWNNAPIISRIALQGSHLEYTWNEDFARLYGHPLGRQTINFIGDGVLAKYLKFPNVRRFGLTFGTGSRPDPREAIRNRQRFVIEVRIEGEYEDVNERDITLDVPGAPRLITLPERLLIELRLYLVPYGAGQLGYIAEVSSTLLDMLMPYTLTYPVLEYPFSKSINLGRAIKDPLEEHINALQVVSGGNRFDRYLRPWLIGRERLRVAQEPDNGLDIINHLHDIVHDAGSPGEVVITYVGPQRAHTSGSVLDSPLLPIATPRHDAWRSQPRLLDDLPSEMPLPPTVDDPLDRPPSFAPTANDKIDHIVVLMMENRSFDQVLGYLSRDGMLPRDRLLSSDVDTVREGRQEHVNGLLPDDNSRDSIRYPDRDNEPVYRSTRTRTTAWPTFSLDNPCHGHGCVETQIASDPSGSPMKGFVGDYANRLGTKSTVENLQLVMNYFTDAELPAYGALTREFAICDGWFCSHIGGTLPNRFISLTGDLTRDDYGRPQVENPDVAGGFLPVETKTFFDHLTDRGVSWVLFEHGYSTLRLFRNFTFDETNIRGFLDGADGFVATVQNNALPQVTYIEPDYIELPNGNDDHAPADMANGQKLVATIVGTLLDSEQWEKTMLIITYDEHGGFYDHEPLPYRVTRDVNGTPVTRDIAPLATGERRLGVRVPAFVISPYIPPMTDGRVNVAKAVYEHTSIPATILRRFCGPRPPQMSARVDSAADLRDLLTLAEPRPRSDFDQLANELREIASRPLTPTLDDNGDPAEAIAAPLQRPADDAPLEEEFHRLLAFASSITGRGR